MLTSQLWLGTIYALRANRPLQTRHFQMGVKFWMDCRYKGRINEVYICPDMNEDGYTGLCPNPSVQIELFVEAD